MDRTHVCESPDHCSICDENAIAGQIRILRTIGAQQPRIASLIRSNLVTLATPGNCACGCDMSAGIPGAHRS